MVPSSTENKLKIFSIVVAVLLLADLAVVNFKVFSPPKPILAPTPESTPEAEVTTVSNAPLQEGGCSPDCLAAISAATKEAKAPVAQPTQGTAVGLTVKEFYIPFGSGSTKNNEWVELPGVEAVIDSANFFSVKSIIMEATLRIPSANGRVYAKLYDVTNKHDVWFSEVWAEGSTNYRAESAVINLSSGRNLYRLMMKSTMGYEAILDLARLKIVLK